MVAGANVAANSNIALDTGAIAVAGNDISLFHASVPLETGSITIAGSDITAPRTEVLDTGAITVSAADIAAMCTLLLDDGTIVVAGNNIHVVFVTPDTRAYVTGTDRALTNVVGVDRVLSHASANEAVVTILTGTNS